VFVGVWGQKTYTTVQQKLSVDLMLGIKNSVSVIRTLYYLTSLLSVIPISVKNPYNNLLNVKWKESIDCIMFDEFRF
jgi:hypothetical protein